MTMDMHDHEVPDGDVPPDGAAARRPGRVLTRRDFFAGGTALGLGSVAAYLIAGRPASAHQACDPTTTTTTPTTEPPPLSVTSTTQPGTSQPPKDTTPTEPPPGTPWSSIYSAEEGDVRISSDIVLDMDARVRSLTIEGSGRLTMSPSSSITLTSVGNVVVLGELVMRPASAAQVHRVHFDSVNEGAYRGGGMEIMDSDVGLWVSGGGRLSATGAAKNPWARATGDIAAGANRFTVDNAAGWQVGDRLAVCPTIAPSKDNGKFHQDGDNAQAYDEVTVTAVSGNEVTVDAGMKHPHPMMSLVEWNGGSRTYGAEVLNLTRNVVVSGSASGRAHAIFVHCHHPQMLTSVQFDQLGPRQTVTNGRHAGVLGRYPVHFHHCGDGSRGSVVKDCLVTSAGNRAFVPHESHGITLEGCVAHGVEGSAYWWDQPGRHNPTGEDPKTHDSLWTRCVASKVWADQKSENGYRMAGFVLGGGNDGSNTLIDSVAVGVTGHRVTNSTATKSGFHWPEHGQAVWNFKNCLAHNIGGDGILTWQNRELIHVIEDFTAYHCAGHGVEHGAYSNFYRYERMTLVGNRLSGIGCHAVTRRTNSVRRAYTDKGVEAPVLHFKDIRIDGRGLTPDGMRGLSHRFDAHYPDGPTVVENVHVTGCTRAGLYEGKGKRAQYYQLKNWRVDGAEPIMIDPNAPGNTRIDVTGMNGSQGSYTVTK